MSDPEEEPYSIIFASLKHPVRRKILRMLSEKPMTFSEMIDVLKVSSPFLTYHLENLGELVCKTGNGKYRLSTFGETAVVTMNRVEDTSRPAFSRSSRNNKARYKTVSAIVRGMTSVFLIVLAIGMIFASLYFVNYTSSSHPYYPDIFSFQQLVHPDENYSFYIAIDSRPLTTDLFPNESDLFPITAWLFDENHTFWFAGPPTGNTLTHWAIESIHFVLAPSVDIKFSRALIWNETGGTVMNPEEDSWVFNHTLLATFPDAFDITDVTQPSLYQFAITNLDPLKDMNDTIQIQNEWQYFDKPYFYYGQAGLLVAGFALVVALLYPVLEVSAFLWRTSESKVRLENLSSSGSAVKGEVLDKQLVAKLSKKYTHPEQALRYWLDRKMSQGKTREQALKEIEEENA